MWLLVGGGVGREGRIHEPQATRASTLKRRHQGFKVRVPASVSGENARLALTRGRRCRIGPMQGRLGAPMRRQLSTVILRPQVIPPRSKASSMNTRASRAVGSSKNS